MRQLSSSLTYVLRLVLPLLGFVVLLDAIRSRLKDPLSLEDLSFLGWTLVGGAAVGIFLYCRYLRLKTVRLCGEDLLIDELGLTLVLPLRDVKEVRQVAGLRVFPIPLFELVRIYFWRPTELGSRIVFMPSWRLFGREHEHPVVAELNRLAARASRPRPRLPEPPRLDGELETPYPPLPPIPRPGDP